MLSTARLDFASNSAMKKPHQLRALDLPQCLPTRRTDSLPELAVPYSPVGGAEKSTTFSLPPISSLINNAEDLTEEYPSFPDLNDGDARNTANVPFFNSAPSDIHPIHAHSLAVSSATNGNRCTSARSLITSHLSSPETSTPSKHAANLSVLPSSNAFQYTPYYCETQQQPQPQHLETGVTPIWHRDDHQTHCDGLMYRHVSHRSSSDKPPVFHSYHRHHRASTRVLREETTYEYSSYAYQSYYSVSDNQWVTAGGIPANDETMPQASVSHERVHHLSCHETHASTSQSIPLIADSASPASHAENPNPNIAAIAALSTSYTPMDQPVRPIVNNKAREHVCPECGRAFQRAEHVRRHQRTHTNERPFVCPHQDCGRAFGRSDNLNAHLRSHEKKQKKYNYNRSLRQRNVFRNFIFHVDMNKTNEYETDNTSLLHHNDGLPVYNNPNDFTGMLDRPYWMAYDDGSEEHTGLSPVASFNGHSKSVSPDSTISHSSSSTSSSSVPGYCSNTPSLSPSF